MNMCVVKKWGTMTTKAWSFFRSVHARPWRCRQQQTSLGHWESPALCVLTFHIMDILSH